MLLAVATPFVLNGLLITQRLSKNLPIISIIGLSVILSGYLPTQESSRKKYHILIECSGYWLLKYFVTLGPLVFLAIFGPRLKRICPLAVIVGGVLIILLGAVRSHPYRLGGFR